MFSHLTDAQLGAVMTLAVLIGGAIGFLVKRHLTQSSTHERTALLNSLADLRSKMSSGGVGFDQIIELENMVRGKVAVSTETAKAVTGQVEVDEGDNLPQGYWTTVAMSGRASARFAVVDAQVDEALTELATLVSRDEAEELGKSHVPWKVYRKRQMNYASNRFAGGTYAPIYGTLHGIEVTERRLAELQREIEARKKEPF
jgi:uncharacterized protein YecT (DUF1311 family)